ncbi:MAG: hypothetical protein H3C62_01060 [Gemmatimonadaceae bacterium]|nr:hypothetical protein [Gemmatimonadaceae bacterium]
MMTDRNPDGTYSMPLLIGELLTEMLRGDAQAHARCVEHFAADKGRCWGDWLLIFSAWHARDPIEVTLGLLHRRELLWVNVTQGVVDRPWKREDLRVRSYRPEEDVAPIVDALVARLLTDGIPVAWRTPDGANWRWDLFTVASAVRAGQHAIAVAGLRAENRDQAQSQSGPWLLLALKVAPEHGVTVVHECLPLIAIACWEPDNPTDVEVTAWVTPDAGVQDDAGVREALHQLKRAVEWRLVPAEWLGPS